MRSSHDEKFFVARKESCTQEEEKERVRGEKKRRREGESERRNKGESEEEKRGKFEREKERERSGREVMGEKN